MEYRIAIEAVLGVLIGVYALRFSRLHPHLFASTLVASAILTAGWMQGPGYALMDELLLVALTVGMITSPAVNVSWKFWSSGRALSADFLWPALLLLYLAVHALYGAASFGDWRLIRWPVLYAGLLLAWLAWNSNISGDRGQRISVRLLAWVAVAYFGIYVLHWVTLEAVLDVRWETLQAVTWSGSTYAMFPALVAFPLAFELVRSQEISDRRLAYSLISLVSLSVEFYSSRAGFFVLLLAVAVAILHLPWRKAAVVTFTVCVSYLGALLVATFVHLGPDAGFLVPETKIVPEREATAVAPQSGLGSIVNQAKTVSELAVLDLKRHEPMVEESIRMPYAPRASDADRHAHLVCAAKLLNSPHLLLGYGQDRHKSMLMECSDLRSYIKPGETIARSTALAAFVVNYGAIGILLLALVCATNIRKLLKRPPLPWITTLPFYFMAIAWSSLTDFRDNTLVYFILVFNVLAMISPVSADRAK